MNEFPPVMICMTTWITEPIRLRIVEETLATWQQYLQYEGDINLHVADDGSTLPFYPENVYQCGFPKTRKMNVTYSRQERHGVGASLNAGFRKAFETSPLVLYAVDDWRLIEPIDITPWAQLLMEREDVGIVRFGPPSPFLRGSVEIYTTNWQGWALKLDRYGLSVGHRPELFHKRFTDFYGMWDEDINACEVERLASVRYADMPDGPDIVLALPHKWYHFHKTDVPSLSEVEPN